MTGEDRSKNDLNATSRLGDIDWKLHQVVSSDKVASIDQSLVRLQLHLEEPTNTRREIALELSREELERVINKLENAKKALDQLKEQ
mmetsp:Transcript_7778/g.28614  ORF Transcript_7778/g.28614 Transcript_7778/m.28614 type:complete len:87 (+) Transcript_7778:36-296(+)